MNWNTGKKTVYTYIKRQVTIKKKSFRYSINALPDEWDAPSPSQDSNPWTHAHSGGRRCSGEGAARGLRFALIRGGEGVRVRGWGRAVSSIETLAYVVLYICRTLLKWIKSLWRVKPGRTAGRKSGGASTWSEPPVAVPSAGENKRVLLLAPFPPDPLAPGRSLGDY